MDKRLCNQQEALWEEAEGLLGDLFAVECLAQCLRHDLLPQERYSPAMIQAYTYRLESYLEQHIDSTGACAKKILQQYSWDQLCAENK